MTFRFSARLIDEAEDSQMLDNGNPFVHVDLTELQDRIVRLILDESFKLPDRGRPDLRMICGKLDITMDELEAELAVIGEAWKQPIIVRRGPPDA
jgi:hypothetical protein